MVAIVIAVSTTFFYSVNKIATKTDNHFIMVSMIQREDKINIIEVRNGPLPRDDVIINVLDRQGSSAGDATFEPEGDIVTAGDYVKITGLTHGEFYTVSLIYDNTILNKIEYLA